MQYGLRARGTYLVDRAAGARGELCDKSPMAISEFPVRRSEVLIRLATRDNPVYTRNSAAQYSVK